MKPPTREEVQEANVRLHSLLADVYRETEPHFKPENVARVDAILAGLKARTAGRRLLDIGCGTGFVIDIAKRHFPVVRGIDITPAMLAKVDCGGGDVQVTEARSEQIPFADGSFDVCTAYAVLHHLHELGPTLREVFRVLRPGGVFYADLDPNHYFWEALRALPEGRYAAVVEREIDAVRNKDRELHEKFGVAPEILNRAERFKHGEGGFREETLRAELAAAGFADAEVGYNWFLGEGKVIHSPELRHAADALRSHLRELLPLSRHLFKYVQVVARR